LELEPVIVKKEVKVEVDNEESESEDEYYDDEEDESKSNADDVVSSGSKLKRKRGSTRSLLSIGSKRSKKSR